MSTSSPTAAAERVRARLVSELSLPSRVGFTALLLVSLAGVALVAALLLTEVGLPLRTQVAMCALLLICCAWSAFAWWVLARRRVLYAQHLVVAARMAIAFSLVFIVGSVFVGVQGATAGKAWLLAPALGVAMLVVGAARLRSGRARVAALTRRRAELEQLMAQESAS